MFGFSLFSPRRFLLCLFCPLLTTATGTVITQTGVVISGLEDNVGSGDVYEEILSSNILSGSTNITGHQEEQLLPDPTITNNILSGEAQTGTVDTIESSVVVETENSIQKEVNLPVYGDIIIQEIYPHDDDVYTEYLLLHSFISYSGSLFLEGAGRGGGTKEIIVDLYPGDKLIILDKEISYDPRYIYMLLSSITLTNTGELITIIDKHSTVLDAVVYEYVDKGLVAVFTQEEDNKRLFSSPAEPSLQQNNNPPENPEQISCSINTSSSPLFSIDFSGRGDCFLGDAISRHLDGEEVGSGCSFARIQLTGTQQLSVTYTSGGDTVCSQTLHTLVVGGNELCEEDINSEISLSGRNEDTFSELYLSEIHPHDTSLFPEYVELHAPTGYSGFITIMGLGHGGVGKEIGLELLSGERVVITDGTGSFSQDTKIYLLPSISLTNAGEPLSLRRQDGQVIDMIVYEESVSGESLYFEVYSGDVRIFSTSLLPTPGIHEGHIGYLFGGGKEEQESMSSCGIMFQHTESFSSENSINLIATFDEKQIQNSSSVYTCLWDAGGYFDEHVCNPSFFTYPKAGLYSIGLIIYKDNTPLCHITSSINYPDIEESTTSTKEKKPSTYYEDLYRKRKERFGILKSEVKQKGYSISTSGYILTGPGLSRQVSSPSISYAFGTGSVDIKAVLPNPEGKDSDREQIILKNTSDVLRNANTLSLYNGKSKKALPDIILPPEEEVVIEGSLGLVNKPTCISLVENNMYTTPFCYSQASDDQWFYESLGFATGSSLLAVNDLIRDISLHIENEQACVHKGDTVLYCKSFPYTIEEAKSRKKQAKKALSLDKKLTKEKERAGSRKEKYHQQVAKRRVVSRQTKEKLSIEQAETKKAKQESRLHENFVRILLDTLQYEWSGLFFNSELVLYRDSYTYLKRSFTDGGSLASYYGIPLSSDDIASFIALDTHQELPLSTFALEDTFDGLLKETKLGVDTFIKNLTYQSVD